MKRRILASVSLLFLLPAALHADPLADENALLRQQVLDLKARNAALEQACPAAATAAPAARAAAQPMAPAVPPAAPVAAANPPPAAPGPAAPPPAVASAAPAEAPASKPYASAGCDRSYGSGPAPAKWQNAKAWSSLKNGMSGTEVEALLGADHYDVERPGGREQWQYGRCHSGWAGDVTLVNGVLESSNAPDR